MNIRIEECMLPMIGGLLGSHLIILPVKCHIVTATVIVSDFSGSSRDKECNISESMMSILAIVVTKMQHKSCQCDNEDAHTVSAAAALFATANKILGRDTLSTLCAA